MALRALREGRERRVPLPVVPVIDVILILCSAGAAELTAQVWERRALEHATKVEIANQASFWDERAAELCVPAPEPPAPLRTGGMLDSSGNLERVRTYRDAVWTTYRECVEERVEVIPEELLRFTFDRSDAFDMTQAEVEHAEERIRSLVDANRGRRRIYVRGHTDRTGTDAYNYALSAERAWYVGRIVLEHLSAQGLSPGTDFELIPEGLGKSRLLGRRAGESDAAFDSRCRRIEVAFQRIGPRSRWP